MASDPAARRTVATSWRIGESVIVSASSRHFLRAACPVCAVCQVLRRSAIRHRCTDWASMRVVLPDWRGTVTMTRE